ncbi:MAG TPA: IPT/TIG domain-containing protein, partial [Planctomycetota bacterium]|nr:IPT/TIG domain-containing protein [Planctomycetota bacterium]
MRCLAPVVVSAILLASALPAPADLSGVPVKNGNKVLGEFTPAGDVDTFAIQLIAGGKLSVKVSTAKDAFLAPIIEVRDPDGVPAVLGTALKGAGGPKPQVKNLLVGKSGTWGVSIRADGVVTGAYTASFASKSPPKVLHLARTVPGAASEAFEAYGFDGTVLGFSVKLKSGDPVGAVEVVDPAGAPVPLPTVPVVPITRKGLLVKGKNFLLGSGFGSYGVIVDGGGGVDSLVDATILTKHPKPDKTIITLGAEPRPTSMGPATGVGGTMVIISGTGFVTGADVFFGEEQAGPAVVDSPTQMHCPAPPGAAADAGAAVDVFVVNPDGQSGKVPFKFQYIGPPKISSVTPAFSPLEGGVTHTVSGSGFRDPFTLLLGGEAPDSIQLVNGNTITFVGKPRGAGPYTLTVTDDLDRTGSLGSAVTYVALPTVTSVSPDSASFTGGRLITLTGTALFTGMRVFVDGVEGAVLSATGTQATFTLPGGPAGTFDMVVRDQFAREITVFDAISRRGPFVDRSAT